jgi:large subunit ribosomal protein L25
MADSVMLVAQPRQEHGTRAARRLRKQGLIPAVLYGHKEETVSLSLPADEIYSAVRHGVRVLDLKTGGKTEKALIRELQWDHLGKDVLHVDFTRVAADERIHVAVPVELRGIAPGVTGGGILDQPLHALHVECLAARLPESIRVNVTELQLGGAIHVKDLHLPEGVKALDDPEAIVVHIKAPEAVPEPAAAAEAGAQAEPEVIGRKAAEEAAEE